VLRLRRINLSALEHKRLLAAARERDEYKRLLEEQGKDLDELRFLECPECHRPMPADGKCRSCESDVVIKRLKVWIRVYKAALYEMADEFDKNRRRCYERMCRKYRDDCTICTAAKFMTSAKETVEKQLKRGGR